MKLSASLALILLMGLVASSKGLPARKRMIYYQQPAQYYASPQRIMYMQYVQPGRAHAHSTQATSALVAGDTVATGTYLKDCDHSESDIAAAGPALNDFDTNSEHGGEDVLGEAGAHVASSVAEAYPEENVQEAKIAQQTPNESEAEEQEPTLSNNDSAKVPREYNFAAPTPIPAEDATEALPVSQNVDDAAPTSSQELPLADQPSALPLPVPLAPVAVPVLVPAKRFLPTSNKKKVFVELEQSAETEPEAVYVEEDEEGANNVADDNDELEETYGPPAPVPIAPKYPARVPNARRPAPKKPVKAAPAPAPNRPAKPASKPLPAGTFFPIDFGGTNGGAIAIANSFSTGEGGSATSHAVAYGSPEATRVARIHPSKLH